MDDNLYIPLFLNLFQVSLNLLQIHRYFMMESTDYYIVIDEICALIYFKDQYN